MALGAASGYHMTFTLSSKLFHHKEHVRALSLLNMAFAVMPALGVFIGGVLVSYFNWTAPFFLMIFYGILIILLSNLLPEVYTSKDYHALKLKNILSNYIRQFGNMGVISGGLLIGIGTSAIYIFAALSPFIGINIMHLTPYSYGVYNLIPSLGILVGSYLASHLAKVLTPTQSIKIGLKIGIVGAILYTLIIFIYPNSPFSLFLPPVILYTGLSFLFSNAATIVLQNAVDKSNAAAVMSFVNICSAFIITTILGFCSISKSMLLPLIYIGLVGLGLLWAKILVSSIIQKS
jgi:predicted MFS family arabinose efflux permease